MPEIQDKKFLSYDEQVKYLNNDKGILTTRRDKIHLIRYGYFTLVNGYKDAFVLNTDNERNHTYFPETKLKHFVYIKQFDENLSNILLKYLKRIEEEIRSTFMYKLDEYILPHALTWSDLDIVDNNAVSQKMKDCITKIKDDPDFKDSNLNYLNHYRNNYDSVPSWVMIKCVKFWHVEELIECSPSSVKKFLANMYNIESRDSLRNNQDFRILKNQLKTIRKIRNECAHNERVFDYLKPSGRVITKYHEHLGGKYRYNRDLRIIDLLIHVKYFLPHEEYELLIMDIYKLIDKLKNKINEHAFSRIKNNIGLRQPADLLRLLELRHEINYP